ncbi:MAG: radical SAM protein [Deltaproteobacteria bacterium]|nr:radical SAM protein [Deltaproteobacteria bacterium]
MRVDAPHDAAAVPALPLDGPAAFLARQFPSRRLDRVLLVNPPDADAGLFRFEAARRGVCPNFPPYGLTVLAEQLRKVGVAVRILNLNHLVLQAAHAAASAQDFAFDATWHAALDAAIADFAPDLIGVTCMFTMTHDSLRQVTARAAQSGVPVAIGGVHVTNDVERVLDEVTAARFAFLREADQAVQTFVRVVRGERPLDALGQVIFADTASGTRHRFLDEARPNAEAMDVVPAFELTEIGDLARFGIIGSFPYFKTPGTRFATALSTRGCRARCTFCSVRTFNGKGVRLRSVDSVLDELQRLAEEFGVRHVMWLDDDLLKDERRAVALFNGMVRRGLDLTWDASNGVVAASCTDEVIAAAEASGCIALIIGMESGNPTVLRQIAKPGTVETFLAAAEVLRRHERINSNVYLMLGFPNETVGMIRDTIEVSRQMHLDWYRIKPLMPLPSTPIYQTMIEQGLLDDSSPTAVRYMTGAYGRHVGMEQSADDAADFRAAIEALPADLIPSRGLIDDLWFYMNYQLNYARVLNEARPVKLQQHRRTLEGICDLIAPDNAFALYTLASVQRRLDGAADPQVLARLRAQHRQSPFWRERLASFGLELDQLEQNGTTDEHG